VLVAPASDANPINSCTRERNTFNTRDSFVLLRAYAASLQSLFNQRYFSAREFQARQLLQRYPRIGLVGVSDGNRTIARLTLSSSVGREDETLIRTTH
jgi:hypothetical protein